MVGPFLCCCPAHLALGWHQWPLNPIQQTQHHSKLSEAMVTAEKERKRNENERKQREMAEELARQARQKKVEKLHSVLAKPKELVRPRDRLIL